MQHSKIIRILRTFEEKEWRACHKYLKYSSQKEAKTLQIFEYLFKYRKKLDSAKLNRSKIMEKLFHGLDKKTFLNRLSDLAKDVEKFMVIYDLQYSNQSFDYSMLLSRQYRKRGLLKDFQRVTKDVERDLANAPSLDLFGHLKYLQIHHALYFSDQPDQYSKPTESLVEVEKRRHLFSDNLSLFYAVEKINAENIDNIKISGPKNTKDDSLNIILEHFKLLTIEKSDESYWFLSNYIFDNHAEFSIELLQSLLLALINHSFFRIKEGQKTFSENLSKLYLYGLKSELLFDNGKLSETRFLNIVDVVSHSTLALEYREFVDQAIHKIVTQDKESVQNVALAMWSFAAEDYSEALNILNASVIYMTRLNHSLRARWILICSLCSAHPNHEQKEEVLRAAQVFFKRHKSEMNTHTYEGSINLIKTVRMFWNNKSNNKIEKFVSSCKFIVNRIWINKMLEKRTQDSY